VSATLAGDVNLVSFAGTVADRMDLIDDGSSRAAVNVKELHKWWAPAPDIELQAPSSRRQNAVLVARGMAQYL
jgi:hypothetical protein